MATKAGSGDSVLTVAQMSDPVAAAKAVKLVYVSSTEEGIIRKRSGKSFKYYFREQLVTDAEELERIRSLVLPPAWTNVWICKKANGHLQATGIDVRGRKQYRYHALWNDCRNQTKFFRLHQFGKVLPKIRERIARDLSSEGLSKEKVLAAVVSLMDKTGMRIGNEFYEKLYGSFGLTTLKDKHVKVSGETIQFSFRGKKGVEQKISLKSRRLARIVQSCRDIPGKELFQYIDRDGQRQCIESGMVNEYIHEIAGENFTAKDLRTWCGSVAALQALKECGGFEKKTEAKKNIVAALDRVSERLGNTRTVCKKYYVHPCLPDLYEKGELDKWLQAKAIKKEKGTLLDPDEKLLMKIVAHSMKSSKNRDSRMT